MFQAIALVAGDAPNTQQRYIAFAIRAKNRKESKSAKMKTEEMRRRTKQSKHTQTGAHTILHQ